MSCESSNKDIMNIHNPQIIVEAEDSLKLPVQSGFAIDDFGFIDCEVPLPVPAGTCGTLEAQCSNGVCYPANQQCDFALDCCDGTDEIPSHCCKFNKTLGTPF